MKFFKAKYAILLNQDHICGIFFYTLEYFDYLLKNDIDIYLLTSFPKSIYNYYINDKYDKSKLHHEFFKRINYKFNINTLSKIDNLIIFDTTTFKRYKNKNFFHDLLFYNYGNDLCSKKETFKSCYSKYNKRIITFGDKEIDLKVDYHYPLCLNFSIFKEIKEFDNDTFHEKKDNNTLNRNRFIENFHKTFNKYIYEFDGPFDRANRLIPECKFYNKKIELKKYNKDDSVLLRYKKNWKDYDLNNFISPDTNLSFAQFIKEFSEIKGKK